MNRQLVDARIPDVVGGEDRAVALHGALSVRQADERYHEEYSQWGFQSRYFPMIQNRASTCAFSIG